MKKLFAFLFILLMLCGCDKARKIERRLVRDTLITELSDSSLFGNSVSCISCVLGEICFADYSEANVVVLDKDLHLQSKIGKRGDGPDEVVGVVHFVRDESCFHLLDEGSRSIKQYSSSGKCLSTVNIPRDIVYAPWGRFLYLDSLYYLPNIKGTVASVMNNEGVLVKQFGTNSEVFGGSLLLSGNKSGIWAIGIASPIIEKYTLDGVLLKKLDYGELPMIKEITANLHDSENSFTAIVNDACWANEKLYVLITHRVLCFSVKEEIQLDRIYLLPHGFYSSIGVEDGNLYGFNFQNASIDKFIL